MSAYLKKIHSRGMMTGPFDFELSPVTVFTAPSTRGKTRILHAISLLLCGATKLGRHSELKDAGRAILTLSHEGKITVWGSDSLNRENERLWADRKGSVKCEEDCQIPAIPNVLMDSAEYFTLSEREKIGYITSHVDLGTEFTLESVTGKVMAIRFDPHTERHIFAIEGVCGMMRLRQKPGGTVQVWIEGLIEEFKGESKQWKAEADRMAKTVQGITALAGDMPRNLEHDIASLREELQGLVSQRDLLQSKLDEWNGLAERRKPILKEWNALPVDDEGKLRHELENAKARASAPAPVDKDTLSMETELKALNEECNAYQSDTKSLETTSELMIKSQKEMRDAIKQETVSWNTTVEKFEAKLAMDVCPSCGTAGAHWKESVSAEYELAKANWSKRLTFLHSKLKARTELDSLFNAIAASKVKDFANREKLDRAKALAEMIEGTRIENKTIKEGQAKIAKSWASHADSIQAALDAIEPAKRKREELSARLAALDEQDKALDVFEIKLQSRELNIQQIETSRQITELEKEQKRWASYQADEQRNAQAILAEKEARIELEVVQAVVKELEKIQAQMVETAFGKLLSVVNRFTGGIIKAPIEYREGELGYWSGTSWVTHEAFSGTEKALTYAGLSAAMAQSSPIRIVMIDEMGRMDPGSLRKFLDRMVEMVKAGELDQFVGASSWEFEPVEGVLVHKV